MSLSIPVDFDQLAKSPASGAKGVPPVVIRASDLMKNFVYCALDADDSLIEKTTGSGGYGGRTLKATGILLQYVQNNKVKTGTFLVNQSNTQPT